MKLINKRIITMSLVTLSLLLLGGCATNPQGKSLSQNQSPEYVVDKSDILDTNNITILSTGELSDQEISGLVQMREEEKLARDVYTTLGTLWGNKIFTNIAQSEQTHTDAVKVLLTHYNITDPVIDDTVGLFSSPTIQKLYTDLVAQGSISLLNALMVGATVEDLDIKDLNVLTQETTNGNIINIYNNLNKGSRNHLRAYVKNIKNKGDEYTPQYISQSEYTAIIGSSQERGIAGN
ncbi:MAG TPA: DUF2202 domain-containing protein [Candidatus Absconditabacterales bacterium]|nr:DUF2202 domain-containing protein [Candidatus Absconditabacterales bacterium]